jgi:hypothetical protein
MSNKLKCVKHERRVQTNSTFTDWIHKTGENGPCDSPTARICLNEYSSNDLRNFSTKEIDSNV